MSRRSNRPSGECVRELSRKDRDRVQLREVLLAGAASAPADPADASYFEDLRNRVRKALRPATQA